MNFIAIAQSGFDAWAAKPHNAKWFRRIDGTPIPNDLVVCIAQAFSEARALSAAPAPGWQTDKVFANPCIQKLQPEEPFFVLLGRDKHAAEATLAWAHLREQERGVSPKTTEAREIAEAMAIYASSAGSLPSAPDVKGL
jgi:hypothetical protein